MSNHKERSDHQNHIHKIRSHDFEELTDMLTET
jgi:hypothetical protein